MASPAPPAGCRGRPTGCPAAQGPGWTLMPRPAGAATAGVGEGRRLGAHDTIVPRSASEGGGPLHGIAMEADTQQAPSTPAQPCGDDNSSRACLRAGRAALLAEQGRWPELHAAERVGPSDGGGLARCAGCNGRQLQPRLLRRQRRLGSGAGAGAEPHVFRDQPPLRHKPGHPGFLGGGEGEMREGGVCGWNRQAGQAGTCGLHTDTWQSTGHQASPKARAVPQPLCTAALTP